MKFMHLADLHLGKSVNGFSMLEDQRHILEQIAVIARREKPDAVLIAGDVYDRGVPSEEATFLLDDFLSSLERTEIIMISGNHDSSGRLSFGRRYFRLGGVHIAPPYSGKVEPVILRDEYGEVHVWMLTYARTSQVSAYFPDEGVRNIGEAVDCALRHMEINPAVRNVLAAHLFVSGAVRSESETGISVGTLENVSAQLFASFEYTALGHLHIPQDIGSPAVRYCGSPLKYSFSEVASPKSVTVAELAEKGSPLRVREIPLEPLHDMRNLRGSYGELMDRGNYEGTPTGDYLRITLTDEGEVYDAMNRLRTVYPRIMVLDYENRHAEQDAAPGADGPDPALDPMAVIKQFYSGRKGENAAFSPEQEQYLEQVIRECWGRE